jgi:hypothetical protein
MHPVVCAVQPDGPNADGKRTVALTQFVQQPRVSTFQAETTFKIPAGKTALLSGWTHQREVHHDGIPQLAAVPVVGQLFSAIKPTKQKDHLLVLVTPRVIVDEEQEKKSDVSAEQEEPKTIEILPAPESESKAEGSDDPAQFNECYAPRGTQGEQVPMTLLPPKGPPLAVAYVNSRELSLAYDVGNVGPSKLASIDVYFTHDGGQWERYPDAVRPTGTVPITVARDGRYGFTLVARSNAGLALPAPHADCLPQLTVEVDTTAPEVKLLRSPKVLSGPSSVILVSWTAADRNLTDVPASLEWAPTAAGPWTLIEKDLSAVCAYQWVPMDVPAEVYLRVRVCDRAGNVGVCVTPEPVTTDVKIPEVLGVRLTPAP